MEAAGDGRGGGGGRMKIQKQEPHTMMWGKTCTTTAYTQVPRQTSQAKAPGLVVDAKFRIVARSGQDLAPPGDGSDFVRGLAQGLEQLEILRDAAEKTAFHGKILLCIENIHTDRD